MDRWKTALLSDIDAHLLPPKVVIGDFVSPIIVDPVSHFPVSVAVPASLRRSPLAQLPAGNPG
jgi:hypothetical protein